MYDFIKEQYDTGVITAQEVEDFVPLWLTQEEADAIIKGGEAV